MQEGQLVGTIAEARFFAACEARTEQAPEWFHGVREAGLGWDFRGVDAFAYISPVDSAKRIKVPVQIKNSRAGKEEFLRRGSLDEIKHTIVIIVGTRTDEQLRAQLYAELGRVRKLDLRFNEFLERKMSRRVRMKSKNIARARKRQKYRAETE